MAVTFQLPAGPKNLASIFPDVDFSGMEEYYIEVKSGDDTILTTNNYKRGCCCSEDVVRIFFVNYLGGIDAINMSLKQEKLGVKSQVWKKPLRYPLKKWDGGTQRFNVTSNEKLKLETSCFDEKDQEWLKELLATPNAWLQWTGTQNQSDHYIPVIILDGDFVTRKEEERYTYVLELDVELSNENIILRN